ncbi:MAG: nitrate reductase associated protein [Candidatus Binataceae bacterium]
MIRHFKFEDEIHQSLSCVPMAVRRKLDRVGVKVSLEQWQALGRGERLAICHLPVADSEECAAVRTFIQEAVQHRCASATKELSEEMRRTADPPVAPPATLVERARALGLGLTEADWNRLDADERYALIKLGAGIEVSHNLAAALHELVKG